MKPDQTLYSQLGNEAEAEHLQANIEAKKPSRWRYLPAVLLGIGVGVAAYFGLKHRSQFNEFRKTFIAWGKGKGAGDHEVTSPIAQAMARVYDPKTGEVEKPVPEARTQRPSIQSKRTKQLFGQKHALVAEAAKGVLGRFKDKMYNRNAEVNDGYLDGGVLRGVYHTIKNTAATAVDVTGALVGVVGLPISNLGWRGVRGGLWRQFGEKERIAIDEADTAALKSLAKDVFHANKKAPEGERFGVAPLSKSATYGNGLAAVVFGTITTVGLGILTQKMSRPAPRMQLDGVVGSGRFTGNIPSRGGSHAQYQQQSALQGAGVPSRN